MAGGDNGSTVDVDAHIRVDAGVRAIGAGSCDNRAAVDDQPAVGVDAIPFTGFSSDLDDQTGLTVNAPRL